QALALHVAGEPADALDLRDLPTRLAGGVTPEGLEACRHPAGLAAAADAHGLRPAVADVGEDLRGHHQVAVELVPPRDGRARIERLLRPQPLRLEAVRGGLVLHEDAARARDLVPLRPQLVARMEGERQVVAGVDHQPVPEAVDALVGDERRVASLDLRAEPPGDGPETRVRDPLEGALEDPVVVARPAHRRAAR